MSAGHETSRQTMHLDFHQPLRDGYRLQFLDEVVVVDGQNDPSLGLFLGRLRDVYMAEGTPSDVWKRVETAAHVISSELGGRQDYADVAERRWLSKVQSLEGLEVHIGILFMESSKDGGIITEGAGLCHHKAILLKYVCDALEIAPCSLWSATPERYAWNFIRIGNETVRMDPMMPQPTSSRAASESEHLPPQLDHPDMGTYLVDNSSLAFDCDGLAYRMSMNLDDKATQVAMWGTVVYGTLVSKDWLRVGEGFLPLSLQGAPVLVSMKTVTKECPRGHQLSHFLVKVDGSYYCDVCRGHPHRGSVMFGCQTCDYDICGKCAVHEGQREKPWTPQPSIESGVTRPPCQDLLPLIFSCAPWSYRDGHRR